MSREVERYVATARTLIEQGNALRDRGLSGPDMDMTLSPTRFLDLLAEAWEQGWSTVDVEYRDWVGPINPISGKRIRYPKEK